MIGTVGDWLARLDAIAARVDVSLVEAERAAEQRAAAQHRATAPDPEHEALATKLRDAEARVEFEQRRSQSLEDRVRELAAALVGATDSRRRAEALAESAQQQADRALDQLEATLREQEQSSGEARHADTSMSNMLQTKLLEVERLTTEVTDLRRSSEDWRTKARGYRRDLDRVSVELERAKVQLSELRVRDESSSKRVAELDRLVAEQRRELEVAERREKHFRERLRTT